MDITYFDKDSSTVEKYLGVNVTNPGICGHCEKTGEQKILVSCELPGKFGSEPLDDDSSIIVISACVFCGRATEHYYEYSDYEEFSYLNSYPHIDDPSTEYELTEHIQNNFPDFSKIFLQAKSAEEHDLDQIAGMAYRKALEFLVTDFLLINTPENVDKEWLKSPKTSLSQKINTLESERLKSVAKAISFLGNDETHYAKRHPEHDIDSIKRFLKVFLSDIENEINFLEIEKFLKKT